MRVESVDPAGLRPPVAVLGLHEAFVLRVRNQVRQLRVKVKGLRFDLTILGATPKWKVFGEENVISNLHICIATEYPLFIIEHLPGKSSRGGTRWSGWRRPGL